MMIIRTIAAVALLGLSIPAAAEELILPVFALNAKSPDDMRWSTEIYLVNPTPDPVQVAISGVLPGTVRRSRPCGQFMSPTRVVPPRSAVLWTATGLATDLGCADEVLGALTLHADGRVLVTGRMVRHDGSGDVAPAGVLSGGGQSIAAVPASQLPGPTTLLLPALIWHRNPCGEPAFASSVGFANPGTEPVTVSLYLPKDARRAIRINGDVVALPHQLVIEPQHWSQIKVAPLDLPDDVCLEPESFDLEIVIDGPLAVYGAVLDRVSRDGRIVAPVDLEAE